METYVADQPHLFTRPGIKLQYCQGRQEGHALAWHIQWGTEASAGKHERAWSVIRSAIYSRLHNQFQQEKAYKEIMEVKYKGSIQDMITEYNILNIKAGITGVAYQTMLMKELPQQICKQLSTCNPADKTDAELREIILNAGKNMEIWQATEKNFVMVRNSKSTGRVSESGAVQKHSSFRKPGKFENKGSQANRYQTKGKEVIQTFKSPGGKTYAQMIEGVPKNEIGRRREATECLRCAWPLDRKGAHGTMKCFQEVKVTSRMADFVKTRTYQKLTVGGFDQLKDNLIDEYEIQSDAEKEGQVQTSEGELPTEESSKDIAEDWWNQPEELSE
jgi:hypothetical protein